MAENVDPNNADLTLQFDPSLTSHLQAAIDRATETGEPISVALTMSQEAFATVQEQISQGPQVAVAFRHITPEPQPLPEPAPEAPEEEGEEEEEEDETA